MALLQRPVSDIRVSYKAKTDAPAGTIFVELALIGPTCERGLSMIEFTSKELDLLSRALEQALSELPDKPRADITTSDLADVIIREAAQGLRCEKTLAKRAVACVLGTKRALV